MSRRKREQLIGVAYLDLACEMSPAATVTIFLETRPVIDIAGYSTSTRVLWCDHPIRPGEGGRMVVEIVCPDDVRLGISVGDELPLRSGAAIIAHCRVEGALLPPTGDPVSTRPVAAG
jgi:hypothetical protein